jgi:hypothetical protein
MKEGGMGVEEDGARPRLAARACWCYELARRSVTTGAVVSGYLSQTDNPQSTIGRAKQDAQRS